MFNPIQETAIFIKDLLGHDPQLMRFGRAEFERKDDNADYIAVDSLGQAQTMAIREEYDHEKEVITYLQRYKQTVTVDFYGDNAYRNATKMALLINGYKSQRLQMKYNVTIGSPSSIVDLKTIESTVVGNRYQVEIVVQYDRQVSEDLLRIDSAKIEVFPENNKQKEVIVK